jgi:hypothetical protein
MFMLTSEANWTRISVASTTSSTRIAALERMTKALEAAKQARDRGANVQAVRRSLKEARSAFEAGDYSTAIERADSILGLLEPGPPTASPVAGLPSMSGASADLDRETAARRLAGAEERVKEAKARGLNVQIAKAALKQAKKALKAGDLRGAVEYASQAEQLSWSSGPARR